MSAKPDIKPDVTESTNSKIVKLPTAKTSGPSSLKLVETPRSALPLAVFLILFLLGVSFGLVYIPWQQTVQGKGSLIVFSPMDRPQNIEAQIPGRLVKWNVVEGQTVRMGETIAEIADLDSKFLDVDQIKRTKTQMEALVQRRDAATTRAGFLDSQYQSLTQSRTAAISGADERAKQTRDRLRAAEQALKAAQQQLDTDKLNYTRLQELFKKDLRSKRDLELAELAYIRSQTEVERAQASLEVAKRDQSVADLDKQRIENDTQASLNSVQASLMSARETVASANESLAKLEIDLNNLQQRTDQRIIRAPRDGRIVRQLTVGPGETVKSGDVLAVLMPETTDHAVELFLTDNDAPLVSVGRKVRLQFAGWPALQFVGWPSIAVGTFGGVVKVVDAIDDGKHRFRIVIVPDEEAIRAGKDEPWPLPQYVKPGKPAPPQFLRPGAEVLGWVMLDTVSVGFELWRQFNAFPPSVRSKPTDAKGVEVKQEGKDTKDNKGDEEKK